MKDNGIWHEKLRAKALKNPEVLAEYEQFKLEFGLAEQLKTMRQKMKISQEAVAASMHSSKVQYQGLSQLKTVLSIPLQFRL